MAGHFWPWVVLDRVHPPRHAGCTSSLHSKAEAVARGWMAEGDVPSDADAIHRAGTVMMEGERDALLRELAVRDRLVELGADREALAEIPWMGVLSEAFNPSLHPRDWRGRWVHVPGRRSFGYEDLDKALDEWFHPAQLEAARETHPRSGFDVKVGLERRVAKPPEGRSEGDAVFNVFDHGQISDPTGKQMLRALRPIRQEPIRHVYRAVSEAEWEAIQRQGFIQSDKRGVIVDWEGTNAGVDPQTAVSYLPVSGSGRILKIRVQPSEGWFTIPHDPYVRTRARVPIDRIEAVSPVLHKDENTYLSLSGSERLAPPDAGPSGLRTQLQRDVMGTIAVLSREKLRAGERPHVTTSELSARMGRYGQVLGHSAGSLADRGLLERVGPATYKLTRAGLDALEKEHGTVSEELSEAFNVGQPRWPRGSGRRAGQWRPKVSVQVPENRDSFEREIAGLVEALDKHGGSMDPTDLANLGAQIEQVATKYSTAATYGNAIHRLDDETRLIEDEHSRLFHELVLRGVGQDESDPILREARKLEDRLSELWDRRYKLRRDENRAERDALIGVLERLRPMGGKLAARERLKGGGWPQVEQHKMLKFLSDSQERQAEALRMVPRAWVEDMNRAGETWFYIHDRNVREDHDFTGEAARPMAQALRSNPRAAEKIGVGHSIINVDVTTRARVYLHELMHRVQSVRSSNELAPGVAARHHAEVLYLTTRTRGDALVSLTELVPNGGYGEHERVLPDRWMQPYMGKIYGSIDAPTNEVLTCAVEWAFGQTADLRYKDPQTLEWILGVLAAL